MTHTESKREIVEISSLSQLPQLPPNGVKEYAEELVDNGFRVVFSHYDNEVDYSYFNFSKDSKVGYFQKDRFVGYAFSSVHVPNSKYGSGFRVHSEVVVPTIQHAVDALNRKDWTRCKVTRYNSLEDYLNRSLGSKKVFVFSK